jgi:hypothetical protein
MTTTAVFCVIAGMAGVLLAISALSARLLVRRMDDWAQRMIVSFFGSPEELLRRLQEREVLKAQRDSGKPAACDSGTPLVERPHRAPDGGWPGSSAASPRNRTHCGLTSFDHSHPKLHKLSSRGS